MPRSSETWGGILSATWSDETALGRTWGLESRADRPGRQSQPAGRHSTPERRRSPRDGLEGLGNPRPHPSHLVVGVGLVGPGPADRIALETWDEMPVTV